MLAQAEVEFVARLPILRGVDEDGEVGVVVRHARPATQQAYTRHTAKRFAVTQGDVPTSRDGLVHVFQLQQAIGRAQFVHLTVYSGRHDGHLVGKAEVLEVVDALLRLGVVADEGAALDGVEGLRGVEAERGHVAGVEHRDAVPADAERMGSVVDDAEPVFVRDLLDGHRVARLAVDMDGQDGRGARRDGRLDFLGVEVARRRVHVDKDGLDAVPPQRVCGGHETVRRRDDLARDVQGLQGANQGERAVCEEADVGHAEVVGQRAFQLLVVVAVVRQPAALPDVFEIRDELL